MKQKNEGNFKSKKVLIAFMEFIIAIGCLIALLVMLTPRERITETSYSYSRPEEVSRYVVINEYITRIRPLTEYETFKTIAEKTLDSKIKVYSDAEKTKEITEGYISTGMIVESGEGEDYKANVIGDMTKNGDCNVAELTQIIRQIVGLSNLNEEQKLSADFNGDNIINITDVSMCINYIVYGEMEADKVPPEKPEIKIEGEGNKNTGWYRSTVEVEIEEKEEEKTEKTITTVEMEYDGERKRTQTTEEKGFILSKEGRYKITSQSYGKNGTKSEVETKEIVIDKTLPEFISLEKEKVSRESYKLLLEAEDNNGIAKYKVLKDGEEQKVIAIDAVKEISQEITITENGRYKIIIEDVAGNEIEREINITDIEKDEKKYTITFLNYDGSVIETKIYREGETVQEPQTPTKPEDNNYTYTFIGWDKEITKAEKDETYTANYNKSYKNYCIVFKNEDGTQISKKTNYHYGDSVVLPEQNPSKEEDEIATYEFSGWDKEVTNVTENKEYTATYNKTYKNYTIIFKNDNGETISEKTDYHYGDTVNVPIQNPKKAEDNNYTYTFIGWDKEVTNVQGNDEYIAQYNQEYKNYTVTFKDEDGTTLTTKTDYHYGDSVILPESNPSKQEDETYTYEFAGWDKQVSNVTGNETYTAKYNKIYKNYTVKFLNEDGTSLLEKTDYHYGDSVIKPAENPSKESDETYSYEFVGWDKDVSNVDGNVTYTAVYDKKFIEYTVVFKQDTGEIINQTTYHYNEDLVVPENPSKESTMSVAYKFIGWEPEVANKVTSNLEYTAQYEEKEINYNFIFINDDETEIERRTYHYGDNIEFPVAEKEDTEEIKYVFKNWNNISTEEESETEINITFKAEYKEEYYVARLEEKGELEGKSYFTLQEAIRNAGRVPRTIRMLKDVEEAVIVDDDQEITLNLNGKAITGTKTYVIKNYGNLSIEDNSENKEGKVKVTSEEEIGYGIHNREGTLTVKSGLVAAETSIENGTTYAIYNQSEEELVIEGGSIIAEAKGEGAKSCGIYNQAGREIEVTGGVILGNAIGERSTTYGIYNETEGKVEVEEGTIQAKASLSSAISYGIYNKVSEEITISGGIIVAQSDRNIAYGVFNDEGKVTIGKTTNTLNKELEINVTANTGYGVYNNKGEVLTTNEQTVENKDLKITMIGTTSYGIYNNEGKIEVTTGNIELLSSTAYGIYNKKEMNVTGGKITTNATSSSLYGIYNNSNEDTNIENITLIGLERGIYNTKGNVIVKEINIEETKEGIYTGDYSNKVTIESGTIKAIRNGINNNKGTVILKDVEIESNQYGVYNTNSGITEIGEKGNPLSIEKPSIYGKTYGVYQELNTQGEIKFYDGKLEGEQAIYGGIGEIENNTRIVLTQNTIEGTEIIEQTAILEQIPSNNVAKIGDNYYTNLNDAIEAVEENKEETTTIEILANQQLSEVTEIPENKNVTIDLKGYEIETYAQGGLINKGTLEIKDTNINEQNQTQGKILSNIGIVISNEGNLNITSGTITSNNYGIYNYNDGKVVVNGGTVEGKTYGIYNNSSNTQVEVNNGKVTSEKYGIGNDSNNSTTQNIKVTGGIVEGKETGIRNYYGTVNVEGGEVRTKGTNNAYAINSSYGRVNIKGGKVTNQVEGNTNNYSIYTTNSSLNITGGEIVGGLNTHETNLNIGTKDGTIDTNTPTILGNEYGVKFVTTGSKQFNYYDGKIGGIIDSYSGNINEIEEDKEIQIREETIGDKVYKTITLVDEIEYENGIAKIGDTTYKKVSELRNAIANLNDNEQTEVTILNNFETTRVIEVPNNKNVLIDLNGKEVRMSSSIINRGILEITDKTENHEGKIVNTKEAAIINSTNKELKITKGNIESIQNAIYISNGKLIIGSKDQNVQNDIITIKGESSAIYKNNYTIIVEMYDGKLIGKYDSQGTISITEEDYIAKTNKDGEYYETTIELEEPVARIGETDYYTVQSAVDSSNNGETIELLRTIDNLKTTLIIPEGKEITIDLKGYAIDTTQEKTIINNGLLNVQNGSIRNSRSEGIVVENKGTLNVNSGSIAKTTYYTGAAIENKGILNVNNGTIQGYNKGIDNKEGATLTIKGGIIQARERAINNESTKEINILGGTINYYSYYSSNNTYYGIYNEVDSNINITGTAKIVNNNNNNQYGYGIYNNGKGNIVINTDNGITIENSKYGYGIYNNGEGNITLEKGTISVKNSEYLAYGIKNASEGKVEVKSGKIKVQSPKGVAYGIENGVSGEVEITGGEIKATTEEGISYGINNVSIPVLKVKGGTIKAEGEQSYGIYNNSSDLQLGEKDSEVTIDNPIVESDNIGIFIRSIDSKFNFYDGKIIGKTAANVEATVEEGYKTKKYYTENNTKEMLILIEHDSYVATFWNEDKTDIIGQVTFKEGDTTIQEPEIPKKQGYIGHWSEYELKAEDIDIELIYTINSTNGTKIQSTDKNGITWNFTYQNGEATNVYYESGELGERVEVPERLEGCPVISVNNTTGNYRNIFAKNSYESNNTIEHIILPKNLKYIGNYAFNYCRGLIDIEIPKNITNIGSYAFYVCSNLKNIEIPEGITIINDYAFCSSGITEIEIPNNVTNINYRAFAGCSSLTNVKIPSSVKTIGSQAFNGARLMNIEISEGVTSIGGQVFNGCIMKSVEIPSSVTSISSNAFQYCSNLTDIYVNNLRTNIKTLGSNWNYNAYVHYKDCTHTITRYVEDGLTIEDITNNISNNKINCGEDYKFKVINNQGEIVTNKAVKLRSQGKFTNTDDVFEEIYPDDNGVYTIEKVERNKTIIVGIVEDAEYQTTDENEIMWRYTYKGGKATNVYYVSGILGSTVEIPSALDGFEVVSVKNITDGSYNRNIFAKTNSEANTTVRKVMLPSTMTEIGDNAFYNCTGLTEIEIPNSVKRIGNYTFYNCTGLTEINIPNSVENIGNYTFNNCKNIIKATMSTTLINTGTYTFYNCTNLREVGLSDNLETIGEGAFENCTKLTEIKIPNNVTKINAYAFYGCSGLENIEIPDGVTNIGNYTFYSCTGLTSVKIPDSVTSIGQYAFYGCTSLTGIGIKNSGKSIEIPDSVTNIEQCAFSGCSGIESIELPNSITSIAYSMFSGCNKLENIEISNSITSIGSAAFNNCTSLTSVKIPDSVTSIGNYAFQYCSNLTDIYVNNLRANIKTLGTNWNYNAYVHYQDCMHTVDINNDPKERLKVLDLTNNLTDGKIQCGETYKFQLLNEDDEVVKNKTLKLKSQGIYTNSEQPIDDFLPDEDGIYTIENIKRDKEVIIGTIANGTKLTAKDENEITWNYTYKNGKATDVYYESGTLGETVKIPSKLDGYDVISVNNTSGGNYKNIFAKSSSLSSNAIKKVILPNTLKSIENYAFYYCTELTEIEVKNVENIGTYAFYYCTSLVNIELSNVKNIGTHAFYNCTNLASLEKLNVENIGTYAFYGCEKLESVELLNVKNIETYAFAYCSNLKSIDIPEGATSIGDFAGCSSLESINIPEGVTSLGSFYGCSSLTSINIPEGVTSINTFEECSSLENITIPEGITSIPYNAFKNCTSLVEIEIPRTVTSIGVSSSYYSNVGVFYGCTNLKEIYINNLGSNITFGRYWYSGNSAHIHYGDCTHRVTINIETLGVKVQEIEGHVESENIECRHTYKFKLVNEENEVLTDEIVELTKNDVTTRITPDENGIYTIENINRDIEIYQQNGESYQSTDENGLTWNYKLRNGEATYVNYEKGTLTERIEIPETLDNYPVTSLCGKYMDSGNIFVASTNMGIYDIRDMKLNIKYVEMPDTVTYMGDRAFYGLSEIVNIKLSTNLKNIGESTFNNCTKLSSIEIPNNVELIGKYSFSNCTNLTRIEIPDSVKTIEEGAFYSCEKLSSVEIPDSVVSIGKEAFNKCTLLKNIKLSNGLKELPNAEYSYGQGYRGLFGDCTSLENIEIPNNITSIGTYTFYNCTNLKEIIFSNNIESIGESAFENCTSLKNIEIPNNITSIENSAFRGCTNLSDVVIPDSVTNMGTNIFENCTSLTTIEIPNSITTIPGGTFNGCTNLTTIEIPNSITDIGGSAFSGCTSLTSIEIPESVTNIGGYAFSGCTSLTNIEIPESVTNIGGYAFSDCTSLTSMEIPDSVIDIGSCAFRRCSNLESIVLPEGLTTIEAGAFYYGSSGGMFNGCTKLTSVYLPSTLIDIGNWAFYGCTSLSEIEIPNGVTNIGNNVFCDCTSLTDIEIPKSVTRIGNDVFYSCSRLTDIYVNNVKENISTSSNWSYYAYVHYSDCKHEISTEIDIDDVQLQDISNNLQDGKIECGETYQFKIINENNELVSNALVTLNSQGQFTNSSETGKILLPNEEGIYTIENIDRNKTIKIGKISDGTIFETTDENGITWNYTYQDGEATNVYYVEGELRETVEVPNYLNSFPIVSIGNNEYKNIFATENYSENTIVKIVKLPKSIKSIGDYAFYQCLNLKSINIQSGIESIGRNAFYRCDKLEKIEIIQGETAIGNNAFYYCSNLTNVEIPNGATNIGDYAFYECRKLTNINMSEKLTNIGENAFYNCNMLEEVEIPNSVTNIGSYAFYNCSRMKQINIPEGITTIKSNTFNNCINLAKVEIPSNVITIEYYAFSGCNNLTDIYIDNIEANITIQEEGECYAYYHYRDCTHSINIDIDLENIQLEEIENNLIDGKIPCGKSYRFKLLSNEQENLDNKIVIIKSEGEFINSKEKMEIIQPDEDGIYSIEDINRNKTISVQSTIKNGSRIITEDENGIKWSYTYQDGKATDICYESGEIGEILNIPSTLNSYEVISLNNKDFNNDYYSYSQHNMLNVSANDIWTYINYYIYGYTYYSSAPPSKDPRYEVKEVNIPNTIEKIGDYAFYGFMNLSSIKIPDSVNEIGSSAFYNCTELVDIEFSNNINTIKNSAFSYCNKLKTVEIAENITTIEDYAFGSCYNLTDIYIDNIENDITLGRDWNTDACVHYKECRHSVDIENTTNMYINIEEVSDNIEAGKIKCNETYKFRLLDRNGEAITSEKVIIKLSGKDMDEDGFERIRSALDNSPNMFMTSEEGIREIRADENDIYTIENVHRDVTITIGSYQATDENGITWNYSYKDENATNVYYESGELGETIEVPPTLNGHAVVSLYNKEELGNIFAKADKEEIEAIKNVKIPNSVTDIGNYAFYKLDSLSEIELSNNLVTIGYAAFYDCSELEKILIPNSVETIKGWAFMGCNKLTTVEIPDSVTQIDEAAFSNCENLQDVKLSKNINNISKYLFYNCRNLINVDIPNNVTIIEMCAFSGCNSITNIEIPEGVTEIERSAFSGCSSLTQIELPSGITTLNEYVFSYCGGLIEINIPNTITNIKDGAFSSCNNLTLVHIPSSVKTIGESFTNCSKLIDIYIDNLKDDVEIIGNNIAGIYNGWEWETNAYIHFNDCKHTIDINPYDQSIVVEDQTDNVENGSIDCGETYKFKVVDQAGKTISGIKVTITDELTNEETQIYSDVNDVYTLEDIHKDIIINIGEKYRTATDENHITWEYTYNNGKATNVRYKSGNLPETLYIPSKLDGYTVVSLGDDTRITETTNYGYTYSYDPNIFNRNSSSSYYGKIKNIVIPEGVISIEKYAFTDMRYLENIQLPNSLINIGNKAFSYCEKLKSIDIPNNVKKLGNNAFESCYELKEIKLSEKLEIIEQETFKFCDRLDEIEIPDSVTRIERDAFLFCNGLKTVSLSKNIKYIGEGAFSDCTNLETIVIWQNVDELGYRTFGGWKRTQTINIQVEEVPEGWNNNWNYNCKARIVYGYTD